MVSACSWLQISVLSSCLDFPDGGLSLPLGCMKCVSYLSIAVIKHRDQGNLETKCLIWDSWIPRVKSGVIIADSMSVSRQAGMAQEQYLRAIAQSTSAAHRELTMNGMTMKYQSPQLLAYLPQGHTSRSFPDPSTHWALGYMSLCEASSFKTSE